MPESKPADWPKGHMLEAAMGIICNVNGGNWESETDYWQRAAKEWLQAYHELVSGGVSDGREIPDPNQ